MLDYVWTAAVVHVDHADASTAVIGFHHQVYGPSEARSLVGQCGSCGRVAIRGAGRFRTLMGRRVDWDPVKS